MKIPVFDTRIFLPGKDLKRQVANMKLPVRLSIYCAKSLDRGGVNPLEARRRNECLPSGEFWRLGMGIPFFTSVETGKSGLDLGGDFPVSKSAARSLRSESPFSR